MDLGLRDRVALVTGASRGIGAAIAERLHGEGCRLALLARDQTHLDTLANRMTGSHAPEVFVRSCDVTSADQCASAVAETLQRFGRVDIAVNNAGGADSFSPFHELTDDQFRKTWELNVLSAVRIIRAVLPGMRAHKWGRIINISSESAVQPDPIGADYNSAKGALNTLTKTLSKAYAADGILVNTVSPAFTLTPLLRAFIQRTATDQSITFDEAQAAMLKNFRPHIEVRRPGKPEEVAAVVAFLASELASFVNGADLRVDGGSVASV